MTKVLHIEASPKGSRSGSSQLAAWFLSAYREAHPEDEIEVAGEPADVGAELPWGPPDGGSRLRD